MLYRCLGVLETAVWHSRLVVAVSYRSLEVFEAAVRHSWFVVAVLYRCLGASEATVWSSCAKPLSRRLRGSWIFVAVS